LRNAVDSQIIVPGDTGYEQARKIFWGGFDQRPSSVPPGLPALAESLRSYVWPPRLGWS